jgi:hypothetical protein
VQTTQATTVVAEKRKTPLILKILIVLAILILALAAFIATRPADFSIERSAKSTAPPSALFAQVNDFHNWANWSPWAKLDPTMKLTYEGPTSGVGAKYHWVGNKEVGEGRMTIVESVPNERVRINLEFIKPFATTNDTVFTFKPDGGGTNVNWAMSGRNNFMAKAFHTFVNVDKMVGADFEKGLAQMKAAAEAPQPK